MAAEDWFQGPADELFSGRRGTAFDANGDREYTRRFLVRVKDNRISSMGVCYCPGLPLPWSPYNSGNGLEYDLNALAVKFEAVEQDESDWQNWIVTVTYSTKLPDGGKPSVPGYPGGPGAAGRAGKQKGAQTDPTLEPPEVEWDQESLARSPIKDLKGFPFLNSAKQPFSPAPQFDFPYNVLIVTRKENDYAPSRATEYAMAYNSDEFLGAPPGCAQCLPFRSRLKWKGDVSFHLTTYRIRFSPKNLDGEHITWEEIESWFLDAGMQERIFDPQTLKSRWVPIYRGGQIVTQPICLNGAGVAVDEDDDNWQPFFQKFLIRKSRAFGTLFNRGLQNPVLSGPGVNYWNLEPGL